MERDFNGLPLSAGTSKTPRLACNGLPKTLAVAPMCQPVLLDRRRFLFVLGLLPVGFRNWAKHEPFGGLSRKRAMFSRKIVRSSPSVKPT